MCSSIERVSCPSISIHCSCLNTRFSTMPHVMVISSEGYFYSYNIDLENGGECSLMKQYRYASSSIHGAGDILIGMQFIGFCRRIKRASRMIYSFCCLLYAYIPQVVCTLYFHSCLVVLLFVYIRRNSSHEINQVILTSPRYRMSFGYAQANSNTAECWSHTATWLRPSHVNAGDTRSSHFWWLRQKLARL